MKAETLRRLRACKVGGATDNEVLNVLMDDNAPGTFIRGPLRRLRERDKQHPDVDR